MSGIYSLDASVIAGSEAAKQAEKSKRRRPAHSGRKAEGTEVTREMPMADTATGHIMDAAGAKLGNEPTTRADRIDLVQQRLDRGHYQERKVLARVAEHLLLIFRGIRR